MSNSFHARCSQAAPMPYVACSTQQRLWKRCVHVVPPRILPRGAGPRGLLSSPLQPVWSLLLAGEPRCNRGVTEAQRDNPGPFFCRQTACGPRSAAIRHRIRSHRSLRPAPTRCSRMMRRHPPNQALCALAAAVARVDHVDEIGEQDRFRLAHGHPPDAGRTARDRQLFGRLLLDGFATHRTVRVTSPRASVE